MTVLIFYKDCILTLKILCLCAQITALQAQTVHFQWPSQQNMKICHDNNDMTEKCQFSVVRRYFYRRDGKRLEMSIL